MTRLPPSPQISAVPSPSSIFMPPTSSASTSSSPVGPRRGEPTPLPNRPAAGQEEHQGEEDTGRGGTDEGGDDDTFPLPKLRLHIQDVMHPGASRFLAAVDAPAVLARSVQTVLRLLYVSPRHGRAGHRDGQAEADGEEEDGAAAAAARERQQRHQGHPGVTAAPPRRCRPARPRYTPPPTRSVTLILEDMPGVAYTKGTELDDDHKEVHLSMGYVEGIRRAPPPPPAAAAAQPASPATTTTTTRGDDTTGAHEIEGVLVHELVHCFQHNGKGRCPGGLVEGVADWVRLTAGLGPPHWRRDAVPGRWDQGYELTAYFLDWLEGRFGEGTVRRINESLRVREYRKSEFWADLFGHDVDVLWKEYLKTLKKGGDGDGCG